MVHFKHAPSVGKFGPGIHYGQGYYCIVLQVRDAGSGPWSVRRSVSGSHSDEASYRDDLKYMREQERGWLALADSVHKNFRLVSLGPNGEVWPV